MNKLFAFFMLSSVVVAAYGADVEKKYSRWVQNAALIYVYNQKGALVMSVPITHGATTSDIRRYLIDECVLNESSRYTLNPLYNEWWRFGRWYYSQEELKRGEIKDQMEQHGTASFWLKKNTTQDA